MYWYNSVVCCHAVLRRAVPPAHRGRGRRCPPGRGKPGWGKDATRPPWWPKDVPWANVRMDARTDEQKQKVTGRRGRGSLTRPRRPTGPGGAPRMALCLSVYLGLRLHVFPLGKGKPGWGKLAARPDWWPKTVPWANVRMDNRTEEDKAKVRTFFRFFGCASPRFVGFSVAVCFY